MPTSTFFRLSPEKQKRLLVAAAKEFSRVSLQEASIANIVKLAEIPRGSFYQYFEDKEDLYFYYFATLRKDSKKTLERIVKEENGDLFKTFQRYFEVMLNEMLYSENAAFYKNMFLHMDFRSSERVSPKVTEGKWGRMRSEHSKEHRLGREVLLELINIDNLKITEPEEVKTLFQLLMTTMFITINEAFQVQRFGVEFSYERTCENFNKKLSWLKYGVMKQEEDKE